MNTIIELHDSTVAVTANQKGAIIVHFLPLTFTSPKAAQDLMPALVGFRTPD